MNDQSNLHHRHVNCPKIKRLRNEPIADGSHKYTSIPQLVHSVPGVDCKENSKSYFDGLYRIRTIFFIGLVCILVILGFWFRNNKGNIDKYIVQVDIDKFIEELRVSISLPSSISDLNIRDYLYLVGGKGTSDVNLEASKQLPDHSAFSVGLELANRKVSAYFPVLLVPGVITTGLESWSTTNCSLPYFRKRLWGSWTMLRAIILDRLCWSEQLMLDLVTGLDPPNVKLRAAQGFDAADFFVTGYWVWNKIIENLAAIGYEPNNMFSAAYDWRLSYSNLEVRDAYFSKLKLYIELSLKLSGKKSVIISHSMGSTVVFYFLKWVEAKGYGNMGPDWCNDHIEAWINISGSMLGAPKALAAILSGEMRDTAQLNSLSVYGLEKFFSKKERAAILRSLPGIASMLPKGGEAIWGNMTSAFDDPRNLSSSEYSYGKMIRLTNREQNTTVTTSEFTADTVLEYLKQNTPKSFQKMLRLNYSYGIAWTKDTIEENELKPEKWSNPLEARLPFAPDMHVYCLYGVGKSTERSYFYENVCDDSNYNETHLRIDNHLTNKPYLEKGVLLGEGDGTVPLISAGFMCARGWKIERYNPGNTTIHTYEMNHEPANFDIRGGPQTADHVDILGRRELNEIILRIASGDNNIEDVWRSNIRDYSAKILI